MKELTYRKALCGDIDAVTVLLCELYDMPYDEVFEENEELFADSNQAFFLVFDGGTPVGVTHGSLRREYINGTNEDLKGFLEAVYVLPKYRLGGVAAGLVKVTERWMQMNGCQEMASDCQFENTGSYKFHLKIGFEETERSIFFLKTLEPLEYVVYPIDDVLREKVQPILVGTWSSTKIVANGKLWDTLSMPGFAAVCGDDVLGYLFYEFHDGKCEIFVLESLAQNIGIATALIEKVKQVAKSSNASRVIVATSNDNTHAIRFYQRRGFAIREVRIGAMDIARELKPSIPIVGIDGILLRDEIEFVIELE